MGFTEDLLSTARQLYAFTELVVARRTETLGEIHELRVQNLLKASHAVQSSLWSLKRHFPEKLQQPLRDVDRLASYLHRSFEGALDYKIPYSPYRPFNLPIDVKYFDDHRVRDQYQNSIAYSAHMVAMAMLLVHHFVLEFTMFMCAVADEYFGVQVLSYKGKKRFVSLMAEIFAFMDMTAPFSKGLESIEAVPAATSKQLLSPQRLQHFIDFRLPFATIHEQWTSGADLSDPKRSMYCLRAIYYESIMRSLQRYATPADEAADHNLLLDSEGLHWLKRLANDQPWPFVRKFEDDNPRAALLRAYMGSTKDPVYEHATKPEIERDDPHQLIIHGGGTSSVSVVPRRRVRVWRKMCRWTASEWSTLALVTGEASLMYDLILSMAPLTLGNQYYRINDKCDMKFVHLMLTRFTGPLDNRVYQTDRLSKEYTAAQRETYDQLHDLRDPHIPNAVAIQPMPLKLKTYVTKIRAIPGAEAHYSELPTYALWHRPTTINFNDTLRQSSTDPETYNVVWNYWNTIPNEWGAALAYSFNSIYLLHYGKALTALPTSNEQCVYGSNELKIQYREYHRSRHAAPHMNLTEDNYITYPTARKIQTKHMETMDRFIRKFKGRPVPFLHPTSWLYETNLRDHGWELCDESYDACEGTVLSMPPDEDGGGSGKSKDSADHYGGDDTRWLSDIKHFGGGKPLGSDGHNRYVGHPAMRGGVGSMKTAPQDSGHRTTGGHDGSGKSVSDTSAAGPAGGPTSKVPVPPPDHGTAATASDVRPSSALGTAGSTAVPAATGLRPDSAPPPSTRGP